MASSIFDWSTTAASNSNSDSAITWSDSQAPSSVDDSGRAMMGRVAELRGDIGGALTAGGSANALTVTVNSAFTTNVNGRFLKLRIATDNSGAATLNVNGIGAKSIRKMLPSGESALTGGELQATGIYDFVYSEALNAAAGGWLVLNPTDVIPVPRTNYLINGNFDIWQRDTSFTTTSLNGGYTADRWITFYESGSGLTTTRQAHTIGQTTVPGEPQYFIRLVSTGVTGLIQILQKVEGVRTLAGKTVTLTFWARIGSGTVAFTPVFGQVFGSGGSGSVNTNGTAGTLTTTFQKFTSVVTLPSISGKTIGADDHLQIVLHTIAASARTMDFSRVSLVEGDASGDVDAFTARPIAQELALCLRYCYSKNMRWRYDISQATGVAIAYTDHYPPMRIIPTATIVGDLSTGWSTTWAANSIKQTCTMWLNQVAAIGPTARSLDIGVLYDAEL